MDDRSTSRRGDREPDVVGENGRDSVESLARIRDILESTHDWLWEVDRDGRYTYVSPQVDDHLGYRPDEMIGLTPFDIMIPEEAERVAPYLNRLIDNSESLIRLENWCLRKDGTKVLFETSGKPFFDDSGNLLGYRGIDRDVTPRWKAHRLLQESEERLRTILETANEGFYQIGGGGRIQVVNPELCRLLDRRSSELIGHTIPEFLHSESIPEYESNLSILEEGGSSIFELALPRSDGDSIHVLVKATPLAGDGESVSGSFGMVTDITERKRAERERAARLRFFECMERIDGIINEQDHPDVMLDAMVKEVLRTFDADRAWLLHPCDPEAPVYRVPIEHTKPEYPGVSATNLDMPMDAIHVMIMRLVLDSNGPVVHGPGSPHDVPQSLAERFRVRSILSLAIRPRVGRPWVLGLHQCSHARRWTRQECELFREIGRRMADGLGNMLFLRDLKESENRYRTLFETMNQGVVYLDREGRIISANPAAERILGVDRNKMMGRTSHAPEWKVIREDGSVILGDEHPSMVALREGRAVRGTVMGVHNLREDAYRWILVDASPQFRPGEDRPCQVYTTFSDITELRTAREAARETRVQFANIVQASPMGILIYRLDEEDRLVLTGTNPAATAILGMDVSRCVGLTLHEIFPPLVETEVPDRYRMVCTQGVPWRTTQFAYEDDRVKGIYEVYAFRIAPRTMTALFLDVTERQRTVDALAEREATLRSLFRAAPTGIGMVTDRIFDHVNERICEMTGYNADELIGRNARMLYPTEKEYLAVGRNKYAEIESKGTGTVETRWQCKNGDIIDVLLSSTPIDPEDLSKGVTFTALDITERKRLERELHQSRRLEAIGQLAGGVAHDFNNLLTAVMGNVDLALFDLEELVSPDHEVIQRIRDIEESAERAAALTRQLLTFSRRQIAKLEVLDLNLVLDEMGELLRRLISEDIHIEFEFTPRLPHLKADKSQIEQVIMNLALNGRDAMIDGGTLSMVTSHADLDETCASRYPEARPGRYVCLTVTDTGAGMDAETREKIFEPFFTTKAAGQGTGLGLATVYGIVKQAGGHLTVDSAPGEGTRFRIFFPAVEADSALASEAGTTFVDRELGGSETVMLCEDDRAVRILARHLMKEAGYDVISASCGTEALDLAGDVEGPIHLLVTDVVMPDMNGKKLAETLSGRCPDMKVLYISGYAADVISHRGVLDEGVEFLEKPFSRKELLQRMRQVLEEAP